MVLSFATAVVLSLTVAALLFLFRFLFRHSKVTHAAHGIDEVLSTAAVRAGFSQCSDQRMVPFSLDVLRGVPPLPALFFLKTADGDRPLCCYGSPPQHPQDASRLILVRRFAHRFPFSCSVIPRGRGGVRNYVVFCDQDPYTRSFRIRLPALLRRFADWENSWPVAIASIELSGDMAWLACSIDPLTVPSAVVSEMIGWSEDLLHEMGQWTKFGCSEEIAGWRAQQAGQREGRGRPL